MPWSETDKMDQRRRFVSDYQREYWGMTELCQRYGVSRTTGYKWIERFEEEGRPGLEDRSKRPRSCPHATPEEVVREIVEFRKRHPLRGAKKIEARLRKLGLAVPARSTICDILKREGLIEKKRKRRKQGHPGKPETRMDAPNETWTVDFKGQFKTRDGIYCYPLTVADGYSRYVLCCQALYSVGYKGAFKTFRRVFEEYGLPKRIRSDNGVPFATPAIARLSELSVWWIRLGIFPELIELASPQQNGRHERMHRTLKELTTRPPAGDLRAQQRKFNGFLWEFNEDREHEALGQETPASFYESSPRPFPKKLPELEYPSHWERRLVSRNGGIRWKSNWVNVSHSLREQHVALEAIDDGLWTVYFGPVELGRLDERDMKIEDTLGRKARKRSRTEKC